MVAMSSSLLGLSPKRVYSYTYFCYRALYLSVYSFFILRNYWCRSVVYYTFSL
jgi:hypothetical protein